VLAPWAADCAERVLPLFEVRAPADRRPRDAVDGLRAFARGELRVGAVRALAVAAHPTTRPPPPTSSAGSCATPRRPCARSCGGCRPRLVPPARSGR